MGQGHDDDCCCCDHGVCVSAWSIAAICDEVSGDSAPDCSDHAVPGAISGAVVTITRTYTDTDGDHTETVGTCTTGGSGRCCVEIPLGIEDPIPAPTVDPDGGGSSGCLLLPDTYDVRYAYRNAYPLGGGAFGETLASFPSPTFQIGVPDPTKFPTLSAPVRIATTLGAGGFLAVGSYQVKVVYRDSGGGGNVPTSASAAVVVATLGDVPTVRVPSLSLRENAATFSLYLATGGGFYRLYKSGLTATDVDLDIAYNPAGAVAPTTNTSARNIPRVTFPFGGYRTIVYTKSMTDRTCKSFTATASPKDLSGTPNGTACSNEINTTRGGHYDVTVQPPDSVPATGSVDVLYGCFTAELSFGFCNYHIKLDVVDHDGAGAVSGWYVLGDSGHVTYDSDGLSVVMGLAPLAMTGCVFYANEESLLSYCREDTGGGTGVHNNLHHISVRAPGYWDRCINFNTPCTVPAPTWEFTVDMYSKEFWVQNPCCNPCPEVPGGGLVPEMIPMHLMASFQALEAVTGSSSPVTYEITYNPTRTAAEGELIWDAIVPTGGWSWCMASPLDYQCLKPGPDPYNPCDSPTSVTPLVAFSQHFFGSARLTWRPQANTCKGDLGWRNYWGSGPDDDTPPTCDVGTLRGGICSLMDSCSCGEIRPSGHTEQFVAGIYGTTAYNTSAPNSGGDVIGPTTVGTTCSIVNWSQSQNPIIPVLYRTCPEDTPPVCSGTVTEA